MTHVIFDLDGTLLDTEGLYTEASRIVAAEHGKVYTLEIKRRCMGGDARRSAQIVIEALDLPMTVAEYLVARERELLRLLEDVQPMHGAEALVRNLAELGVPMAIATSSHRDLTEAKLSRHSFLRNVNRILCGDDARVEEPKPSPDIFLLAAAELDACPDQCIAIEDSPNGVAGAVAAGMYTIALVDARFEVDPSAFDVASRRIRSLTELEPRGMGLTRAARG